MPNWTTICAAVSLTVAGANPLAAQTLLVTVRDTLGNPVKQASLTLVDSSGHARASARTGDAGTAHMPRADTGAFRVFARRFGFRPQQSDYFHISGADTVAVRIDMVQLSTILDPVLIKAERDEVRDTPNAFGINLRATGGKIITPTEIDYGILGARDVADVLARQAIAGVRIDQRRRCLTSTRSGRCLPFVVDGQLFRDGSVLQDVVMVESIDYMVVLRGLEVGVRYGSIGTDGILLIATRRDWRRVLR
jgi:hypothetical protein